VDQKQFGFDGYENLQTTCFRRPRVVISKEIPKLKHAIAVWEIF